MAFTDDEIKWVFDRTDGHCFYCGTRLVLNNYGMVTEFGAWDINCFMPPSGKKERSPENWVGACIICDTVKSHCLPWEFDARRFMQGDENPDNYITKKAV